MNTVDLQTTMEHKLILRISKSNPNEIKVIIPRDGKEICCERLVLEKPINKVSPNSPWSTNLKAKIKRSYIKLGKSETIANVIIKEEYYDAIMELQRQNQIKIDSAKQEEASNEKVLEKEHRDKIRQEAREFKQYLKEHNATIMDFLEFISWWLLSGESKNIQTVFFAHFSTLTGLRPVWTMFLGGPGEGKSAIEQAGFSLIPKSLKYNGRKSWAAILNLVRDRGSDFLDKKVIGLGDLGGKNSYMKWEEILDVYKELSSEGIYDYSKMEDSVDRETRQKEIIDIILNGHPSVSFSSVHSDGLTGQYLSRGVTITPIGSDDDVLYYRRYTRPATFAKDFRDELTGHIMDLFHSYIENLLLNLETVEVINPYYLCLQDWFKTAANNKRSSEMFPLLVDSVTLFNYESRQSIKSPNGKTYYIATKEDNERIANLFDITPGLTSEVVAFYNKLVKIIGEYNYEEFEEYERDVKDIKQCKTIFTIGTLKNRRLKRASSDEKDQFADFCHILHDNGKLVSIKKNSKGHHIYCLESPVEPLGTASIDFTPSKIKEYLDEDMVSSEWGMKLPKDKIRGSMKKEIPQNIDTNTFVEPPWNNGDLAPRDISDVSEKNSDKVTSELE